MGSVMERFVMGKNVGGDDVIQYLCVNLKKIIII